MRLLKRPEVEAKTAKKKSKIYADMARGLFPKPVVRSVKDVAWVEHEIDHLNQLEIKARDLGLRGNARDDFIRAELAARRRAAGQVRP